MNWLNQDWEHELQKTEMYVLETRKKAEEELEEYLLNGADQLPALIEYFKEENKKSKKHENKLL